MVRTVNLEFTAGIKLSMKTEVASKKRWCDVITSCPCVLVIFSGTSVFVWGLELQNYLCQEHIFAEADNRSTLGSAYNEFSSGFPLFRTDKIP